MWGSESKHVTEGLQEERKALALRYTIDAAEAERREELAVEATATQARGASGSNAARREGAHPKAAPAAAPQPSHLVSSLRERLGRARNHQDVRVAEAHVRLRAGESPDGSLRCARCGHECSYEARDWTLRLCGDDQLHTVCRDCDERDFDDARKGGPRTLRPLAE